MVQKSDILLDISTAWKLIANASVGLILIWKGIYICVCIFFI